MGWCPGGTRFFGSVFCTHYCETNKALKAILVYGTENYEGWNNLRACGPKNFAQRHGKICVFELRTVEKWASFNMGMSVRRGQGVKYSLGVYYFSPDIIRDGRIFSLAFWNWSRVFCPPMSTSLYFWTHLCACKNPAFFKIHGVAPATCWDRQRTIWLYFS